MLSIYTSLNFCRPVGFKFYTKGYMLHVYDTIFSTVNRSSIATLNDETHKATKKLNDASKLLRKVREDLTNQVNNAINLSSMLQEGDDELKQDLEQLRKHGFESSLAWESMIAGRAQLLILIMVNIFRVDEKSPLNKLVIETAQMK